MHPQPFTPLIKELLPAPDPMDVFQRLSARSHCLFLDSALRHNELGRFSFVTADPFDFLTFPSDSHDSLKHLEDRLNLLPANHLNHLPPFQGGAAGLLSYDLGQSLERLPATRHDEFSVPALAVGLYDVVVAFDHQVERAWIISQGLPALKKDERARRAAGRLSDFLRWLHAPIMTPKSAAAKPVPTSALAPQFAAGEFNGLTSTFSATTYRRAVEQIVEYIHAGDLFQANFAQRLLFPAHDASLDLYLRLRKRNPSTFAAFFDLGDFQIVSASPERFIRIRDRQVETRPIKGTRGRSQHPVADLFVADDLRQSEKDRAENVMIVDLMRNDLSRVCDPESVQVSQLCDIEVYEYVQHLVSAIRANLRPEATPIDLIRATFPGGSITGAPKVRAMEIIAELEPTARGPYCGSLGYIGFDGTLDLSILIRTITAGKGWWQFPVGGGIVAQSDPQDEYKETWHKAEGMLRSIL